MPPSGFSDITRSATAVVGSPMWAASQGPVLIASVKVAASSTDRDLSFTIFARRDPHCPAKISLTSRPQPSGSL